MDAEQKQSMTLCARIVRGPESRARGLSDEDLGAVAYWNADPVEMERVKRELGISGSIITIEEGAVRVVVQHPEGPAAYRVGRIEDQANIMTGEVTPKAEVAEALLAQARAEYPGCVVSLETFVDNGDGTGSWSAAEPVVAGPAPVPIVEG